MRGKQHINQVASKLSNNAPTVAMEANKYPFLSKALPLKQTNGAIIQASTAFKYEYFLSSMLNKPQNQHRERERECSENQQVRAKASHGSAWQSVTQSASQAVCICQMDSFETMSTNR